MKTYQQRIETLDPILYDKSQFTRNPDNAWRMLARLLEESGELSGAVKSYFGRTHRPEVEAGNIVNVILEIGDAQIILYKLGRMFGVTPEQAAQMSLDKLEERMRKA